MRHSQKRKVRIALIVYSMAVFAIMLYSLFQPGTETVERSNFGILSEETFELTDENFVEMEFTVPSDRLTGIAIGYDANEQTFNAESVEISIYQDKGSLLQQKEVELSNQKDGCEIYIPTEFEAEKGTRLTLCIQSHGLEDKGILLGISDGREISSTLKIDGVLQSGNLYGSVFYYKLLKEPVKIIIAFVTEVLAGLLVYYIYSMEKLPVVEPFRRVARKKEKRSRKEVVCLLFGYIVLALGIVLVLEYTYHFAVKDCADKNTYYVLNEKTEKSVPVSLQEGAKLTQSITCKTENLSGIGFGMGKTSGKRGKLNIQVYDEATGELLTEKSVKISKLQKMKKLTERKEDSNSEKKKKEEDLMKNYAGVTFDDAIEDALGRNFVVELSLSGTGGSEVIFWSNALRRTNMRSAKLMGEELGSGLCLVSFYKPYLFLKTLYFIFSILLGVSVTFLYCLVFWKKSSLECVFLGAAYALGIFYLLMITVYGVPDETAHIDTVYRVSNEIMGIGDAQGPNQIYKRFSDIEVNDVEKADVTVDSYKELYDTFLTKSEDSTLTVTYGANTLANSTKWNYLPAAVGFTLARIWNWGFIPMVLLGRLFNLIVAGIMMFLGIRKLPFGKTVFAIVGLLPITLQQMASCSYDAVLLGAAFMFAGYCLYLAYGETKGSLLDYIILVITVSLIVACKGGAYLPYICLCLLIPFARKKVNIRWTVAAAGMLLLILLIFVRQYASKMFDIVTAVQGNVFGRVENVELYSFSYFLKNPIEFLRIFENTFVMLGEYYLSQVAGGLLGKLNIKISWVVNVGFLLLLFLAALRKPEDKQYISAGNKWYMGILCLGSLGLVALSMLVSWTPFGDTAILGIQGRYFLPFLGIAVLLLRNSSITYKGKSGILLVFAAAMLNVCVFSQILLVVLSL